ncbi:DUF7683 domain-containing protein [Tellurirhabdus rosea]|uniref:DUF7683 domain-containing protein n=1 Tax=Tellurirhabdus rosea TaxID=2674997 RepID=UPI00225789C7|nr:hypothetical protein [Tellurirhabdus rosea]
MITEVYAVQRVISVFDRYSSEFVSMVPVRHFELEKFLYTFEVPSNDPMMYEFYEIRPEHLYALRNEEIYFDFDRYNYYVECAISE